MPPSAISGTPVPSRAAATLAMAEICGTPTPATMRVVQIEPGPMPTLTASAPASARALAASAVAMLPPITWTSGKVCLTQRTRSITPLGGRGRCPPPPRRPRRRPARQRARRYRRRCRRRRRRAGGPARPGRQRVGLGLLDVTEGHQATQVEVLVDHQHLLDAVLVELGLHLFQRGAFAGGDQLVLRGHDRGDGIAGVRLHPQVATGDDTDQLALLHHRETGEAVLAGHLQQFDDLGRGVTVTGSRTMAVSCF